MLLERNIQLEKIVAAAGKADEGRGSIILISGEAGIGKTSLLEQARDHIQHSNDVYWGGCDALQTPRALGPLYDMDALFGEADTFKLEEGASTTSLFTRILRVLEQCQNGIVLVFEDVHWADHVTLDMLQFLGRRIPFLKVLLLISYRDDEADAEHPLTQLLGNLPARHTKRLKLSSLSPGAVVAMAKSAGQSPDGLYLATGGNPFFLTELLNDTESLEELPASIKDAVNARINRITAAEIDFLETISVFPNAVKASLFRTLFGENGETWAMACVGRNILVKTSAGEFRFRHELARLTVLSRIEAARIRSIHQKILEALEQEPSALKLDYLTHHAAEAGDADRVLKYAPLAANAAATVGAHREAASHLHTALRFVDHAEPELAAQLYESWAYERGLIEIDDSVIEARRHTITLWRALKRPEKVGENLRWLSRLHWYRGEAIEANRLADEAVEILETIPPSVERAMALSLRSQLHMLNDRMNDAISWGEKALKMADKFNSVEVRVHALNNIGTAMIFRDNADGKAFLQESLELARRHHYDEHAARVYTNLAEYAVEYRQFELAEQVISDGIAFDTQHDLDAWTHYLVGRLASLRLDQGQLHDAVSICEDVLARDRLTLLMRLPAKMVLAKAQMRLGAANSNDYLEDALADAKATEEVQYLIPMYLAGIEYGWLHGREQEAHQYIDTLSRFDAKKFHPWSAGEYVIWVNRLGRTQSVFQIANLPEPYQLELARHHIQASKHWHALGAPYCAALSLLHSDGEAVGNALNNSIKILDEIDAKATAARARSIAKEKGVRADTKKGSRRTKIRHPLGLTKREQEILVHVIQGSTNKEIAELLCRSHRTIEHHVSSILRKLNVETRMEAMLRIHAEPWLVPD